LLAAIRWPLSADSLERIARAAKRVTDGPTFIALANRHRVGPLAFRSLHFAGVEIPGCTAAQAEQFRQSCVFAEMTMVSEFTRLKNLLGAVGIDAILLKGPGLSLRAFGELGLRTYRDLDLLISEQSIAPATALLSEARYELLEPPGHEPLRALSAWRKNHKDALFRHRDSGLLVELHWRLFDNHALMPAQELSEAIPLGVPPLEAARVLPLESELQYLCLHGALHGWSRLRWLADINALIGVASEEVLLKIAAAGPACAQALILCRELLGASSPTSVNRLLDESKRGHLLARIAWSEILRSGHKELEAVPFGSTVKNLSHYAMLNSAAAVIEELRFDLTVQPRTYPEERDAKGRIAEWAVRHLGRR
jgi:hypothetical protein